MSPQVVIESLRESRSSPVRGIVTFVAGYTVVDLLPVALPAEPRVVGLPLGDAMDVLLVFLLVYLYVELALQAGLLQRRSSRLIFSMALLLLVQGHAIHLAANAIAAASEPTASGWGLIHYLDERWGHAELHFSILLLAALFIFRSLNGQSSPTSLPHSRSETVTLWGAILLYGVLLAGDAVEGQTVPFVLPGAVVLCGLGVWPYLARGAPDPPPLYRRFFATSLGITVLALVAYGLIMSGFPEITSILAR